jgi:transcriptional regulator with XRE-family HTH domain
MSALRKKLGLLHPEEIKTNRESLGLKQRELAEHLGTAEETISRWENGLMIQSRAMDKLLRLYFYLPEARQTLSTNQASTLILSAPVMKRYLDVGVSYSKAMIHLEIPQYDNQKTHLWLESMLRSFVLLTCDAPPHIVESVGATWNYYGQFVRRISGHLQQMELPDVNYYRVQEQKHLRRVQKFTKCLFEMPDQNRDLFIRSVFPLATQYPYPLPNTGSPKDSLASSAWPRR